MHQAHKTGLGSSAALVTAFVAAVTSHYLNLEQTSAISTTTQSRFHNLAQAVHCAAQGKVGSGFDVAAAVYGSCIYRKFSPSVLEGLGEPGSTLFSHRLRAVVDDDEGPKKWDVEIKKSIGLMPRGIRLVMCDVDCGSQTVGMVKKVLQWRQDNVEDAALLWETLQRGNEDLSAELHRLTHPESNSDRDYRELGTIISTIRSLIREMSAKAGVPIEPPLQTELIDTCSKVPGVIGGMVPGAGGYDAVALLIEDCGEVVKALSNCLAAYKASVGQDQEPSIGSIRLLGVRQEMQGLMSEDPDSYGEWLR